MADTAVVLTREKYPEKLRGSHLESPSVISRSLEDRRAKPLKGDYAFHHFLYGGSELSKRSANPGTVVLKPHSVRATRRHFVSREILARRTGKTGLNRKTNCVSTDHRVALISPCLAPVSRLDNAARIVEAKRRNGEERRVGENSFEKETKLCDASLTSRRSSRPFFFLSFFFRSSKEESLYFGATTS